MKIIKFKKIDTKEIIDKTINVLKNGGIVVFPTDTIYGLLADATNKKAVDKLFQIKKRDFKKPLPIFVSDISVARNLAILGSKEEDFLKKNWPGQITVVLKRKKTNKEIYGTKKDTIALRIPDFPLLNEVLKKINRPLTGTSANISGKHHCSSIKEAVEQFRDKYKPDFVVDFGLLPSRKPSKIIDLTSFPPKVLRRQ